MHGQDDMVSHGLAKPGNGHRGLTREEHVDDGHETGVDDGKDDVILVPDAGDGDRGDLNDHVVDDPVAGRGDGATLLTVLQAQDLGRVDPDDGLETGREQPHVDKEDGDGTDPGRLARTALDLPDEPGFGGETTGHERDADKEESTTADRVDEEPRDERGQEEPSEQDSGDETGAVVAKTGTQEQGARVVDDTVDTTELLHDLNTTGDEESLSVLEVVVLEQSLPGSRTDSLLELDGDHDVLVLLSNGDVVDVTTHETGDGSQGFLLFPMSGEPSRRFGNDEGQESDGDDESTLKGDGDSPSLGTADIGKPESDPVGEEDSKVQAGELGGEESTSSGRGCGFGQDDGAGRVDETHPETRDDTTGDHGSRTRDSGLDTSSGEHQHGTDGDTLASSETLSDDGSGDGTDAASDFVLPSRVGAKCQDRSEDHDE